MALYGRVSPEGELTMSTVRDRLHDESRSKQQKSALTRYRKLAREGFNMLRFLGLSPEAQGRALGFDISWQGELDDIKSSVTKTRNFDVEQRIELMIMILARAEALFADSKATRSNLPKWFKTKIAEFDSRTPLSMISSGHMHELTTVNSYLRSLVGYHAPHHKRRL